MVLVQPRAASSRLTVRVTAMSRPFLRREPARADEDGPPPKKDEKMSSMPMPPKMSEKST